MSLRLLPAVLLLALAAACGGDLREEEAAVRSLAPPASTVPQAPTMPAPSTASAAPPAGCTPAPAALVAAVEGAMAEPGNKLSFPFIIVEGGLTFLGANVVDAAGDRVSSADSWVASTSDGDGLTAFSGSARNDLTPDLERSDERYDVQLGSDIMQRVQDCPTLARRAANQASTG